MAAASVCKNHPSAAAVALCVGCRALFCGRCLTQIEGVNHCAVCYRKQLGARSASRPKVRETIASPHARLVGLAAGFVALSGLVWLALTVAGA